jgi:hypothetical protein
MAFRVSPIWLALLISLHGPTSIGIVQVPDKEALLGLHQQLLESVFLRSDASLLAAAALPNPWSFHLEALSRTGSKC